MRILLVEDDRMIAEGVRKALRSDGFAVDWVQDGDAALTALGGETYDLLLLDLGLPKRDGIDVLRTLRARGLARAAQLSWRAFAAANVAIYREVLAR